MAKEAEINGKYLGTITKDFVKVADFLKEASYQVRSRKISDYPIFVMTREHAALGQSLLKPTERENEWYYNFAIVNEFIEKKIIEAEKFHEFQEIYKDADEYCCIFVAEGDFINFIFLPYPEDDQNMID